MRHHALLIVPFLAMVACCGDTHTGPDGSGADTSGADRATGSDTGANPDSGGGPDAGPPDGTSGTDGIDVPDGSGADVPVMPGSCDEDPLRTGLVAEQTGVSADAFDCEILTASAKYGFPDPMLIKAIIYGESRFDRTAAGCPNLPCGQPDGWTPEESGCYGLMQIVPACGGDDLAVVIKPDGHPDLETDPTAPGYAGSVFNPAVNIDLGVSGIAGNLADVRAQFSGCTDEQYTMMAIGNYNSYGSTQSCTEWNFDYRDYVLIGYDMYVAAAGYAPVDYPR
jgi:hypothetical protein